MSEHQSDLPLDAPFAPAPAAPPELRDEIARAWGLPLGERVDVSFQPAFPVPTAAGILELRTAPEFPWNPREPLALRVAGCEFTSRDIARWSLG